LILWESKMKQNIENINEQKKELECDFCQGNCKCFLRQKNNNIEHLIISRSVKNEVIENKGPITFIS
jgi:hypothetical protein